MADEFPRLSGLDAERRLQFVRQAGLDRVERRRLSRAVFQARAWIFLLVAAVVISPLLGSSRGDITPVHIVFMALLVVLLFLSEKRLRSDFARRMIEKRLAAPTCSQCAFPLGGLPVKDSMTRCPECGSEQVVIGVS